MGRRRWVALVLVIPFIAVLWPPFYSSLQPDWQGVPYFIWYQFLWAIISAVLTIGVYMAQGKEETR